ncbi:MAG: hypothetical protein ACHQ1H_08570 [Nitrososphaerales archaeon]
MRSVRISRELDEILKRDAEDKGISVNSLVSEIFTKYSEWDRFADKFGMVTLPRQAFSKIWDYFTKEQAASWGKDAGRNIAPEIAQFWFKRLNAQTFLKLIALAAIYGKIYEYEVETNEWKQYTITVHHESNELFSIWLEQYFLSVIESFTGAIPKIKVGHTSVIITFTEPFHVRESRY